MEGTLQAKNGSSTGLEGTEGTFIKLFAIFIYIKYNLFFVTDWQKPLRSLHVASFSHLKVLHSLRSPFN
jgi:hypothetical protein